MIKWIKARLNREKPIKVDYHKLAQQIYEVQPEYKRFSEEKRKACSYRARQQIAFFKTLQWEENPTGEPRWFPNEYDYYNHYLTHIVRLGKFKICAQYQIREGQCHVRGLCIAMHMADHIEMLYCRPRGNGQPYKWIYEGPWKDEIDAFAIEFDQAYQQYHQTVAEIKRKDEEKAKQAQEDAQRQKQFALEQEYFKPQN